MSGIILTLFLCGPLGCEESTHTFPQFRSCDFAQGLADAMVSRAGPGSWARCREVQP